MKLRNKILGAIAAVLGVSTIPYDASAQIYTKYDNTIVNKVYTPNGAGRTRLNSLSFRRANPNGTPFPGVDKDNGYYFNTVDNRFGISLPAGFEVEFNGQRYTRVQVNVNGFVQFGDPATIGTDSARILFESQSPNAVVAPYWGDHFYRDDDDANLGFVESEISYQITQETVQGVGNVQVLTIEWNKLNINYKFDPADPNNSEAANVAPQRTSIGTFQVKIYQAIPTGSLNRKQAGLEKVDPRGNIEFHYSTVGDPLVPGIIKTSGASVGIESEASGGSASSFMNGLFITDRDYAARIPLIDVADSTIRSTRLTSTWAPSRANNNVIVFRYYPSQGIIGWGDGDANLSQLEGEIHAGLPQNRFVTMTDVIKILRAEAMNMPLDSNLFREAYHADVNHNGRFYYSTRDVNNNVVPRYRRSIPTRSVNEFDDLPVDASLAVSDIYFATNEYDAALILAYLQAKVPTLPWLIDTVVENGRLGAEQLESNSLTLGNLSVANGIVTFPVYANGVATTIGASFVVNGEIVGVQTPDVVGTNVRADYYGNKVVIAAAGDLKQDQPIAWVSVRNIESNVLSVDKVTVNETAAPSQSAKIQELAEKENLAIYPNPLTANSTIAISVPMAGTYTVTVYDAFGNRVKTLVNGALNVGTHSFQWNGTNETGASVANGVYMVRVEGSGLNITRSVTVGR